MLGENINKSIETYVNSDYESIKKYERFQFLINELSPTLKNTGTLLDIGCAKGEFIYLSKEKYPQIKYTGFDYAQELIDIAHAEPKLRDVEFIQGDVQKLNLNRTFDVTLMSGVLTIFDDFEKVLELMVKHTSVNGRGFIFGRISRQDIDVLIRFRNNFAGSDTWESGWNLFSLKSIESALTKLGCTQIEALPFELNMNLERTDNPVKSYTEQLENGKKLIIAANIVADFHLISFTKN